MSNKIGLAPAMVAMLLSGGAAGAYELKLNGAPADNQGGFVSGSDFPVAATGDGALTVDAGPMVIASEVAWRDSPVLGVSGTALRRSQDFSFLIDANAGATPPERFSGGDSGARFYLDFSLTNAVFATGVSVSAFTVAEGQTSLSALGGLAIVDPTPDTDGGSDTGLQGHSSVRLQLTVPANGNVDDIYVSLPLELSNAICSGNINDASMSLTLSSVADAVPPATNETVTPIGSALSKTFAQCGQAYGLSLVADTAQGGGDSALSVPAFNQFVVGAAGPTVDVDGDTAGNGIPEDVSLADTATRAAVGAYGITFAPNDTSGAKENLRFVHSLADWESSAFTGSLDSLFVAGSRAQVTLSTASIGNLASASIGVAATPPSTDFIAAVSGSGAVATVTMPVPAGVTINSSTYSEPIFVTFGTAPASAESISATAEINFAGSALQSSFARGRLSFGSQVNLDAIGFAAGYCGEFDWVNSANDRFDIIRITGFGSGVTSVVATLRNVNVAANAPQPEAQTWAQNEFGEISNGDASRELIITTADLRRKFGEFGTGDLQLMVMGAGSGLDCDRLISAGNAGFISPYGNDASVTNSDGDD